MQRASRAVTTPKDSQGTFEYSCVTHVGRRLRACTIGIHDNCCKGVELSGLTGVPSAKQERHQQLHICYHQQTLVPYLISAFGHTVSHVHKQLHILLSLQEIYVML